MSQLDDFECDAADCNRAAVELIETDDGARVLLCPRCHQRAYDAEQTVALADGRVLAWDMATGWYVLPDGGDGVDDANTHAANLKRLVRGYVESGRMQEMILSHADALAKRLAEAEARAGRWKRYAEWMEFEDWPEDMWGEGRSRFGIDEPAESMDERITKRSQRAGDLPAPDGGAS